MDTTGMAESNYVTVQMAKDSPSKRLVILSGGSLQPNKEGLLKLNLLVEIDGKQKTFIPNKATIRNLQGRLGFESQGWIGKAVSFTVVSMNGKEAVVGVPV